MTIEQKAEEWRKNYKPLGITRIERACVEVETQAKPTKIIENPNPFRITDGWYDLYLKDLENAYIAGAEPREKRIADLEGENAELLKSNSHVRSQLRNKTSDYYILEHHYNLAKEIIEAICDGYESALVSENDMCEKIKKAKTFLKECI